MLDAHRVLVDGADRLEQRGADQGAARGGVRRPVSASSRSRRRSTISRITAAALGASIDHVHGTELRGGSNGEDLRRDHHRPLVGRPLRRPGRRAAGGHGELLQVHRRLADQHRLRRRPARPAHRGDHRRRRRAHGPLHRRAAGPRGRRHPRGQGRPRAADGAGAARHPRRQPVPADLLPRELRRHGPDRGRHRRGLRRRGPRRPRHRHPPQPPAHRGGRPRRR